MYKRFQYDKKLKNYARQLRGRQTDAERLLWSKLRNKQLGGNKFYRQFPIEGFIIDFYCRAKGLAIEIDGSQHMMEKYITYDTKRTYSLKQKGIRLIRFWDNVVLTQTDGVIETIFEFLTKH